MTNFRKVLEFMQAFGQPINSVPGFPDRETVTLRIDLISEEFKETLEAIKEQNLKEAAKELTDLLYVVYGAGADFGIDLDACFEEVHSSNMSKLGEDGKPIYRDDGKVLKGPNYRPADLSKIITLGLKNNS